MGISTLSLLKIIDRVTRKIAPGPAPSFNEAHVVKVLELIGDYGSIGRIRLSKELGLGAVSYTHLTLPTILLV